MLKSQGVFKMISKESYKLLKNFPEKVCLKDQQPIHQELKEAGYLAVDPTGGGDIQNYRYYVTEKGRAAVEEYKYGKTTRGIAWAGVILGGLSLLNDLVEYFCH